MVVIGEEQAGEGTSLCFARMSTCVACICVLQNTLVGVHSVAYSSANMPAAFAAALALINGRAVNALYLVGWRLNDAQSGWHDVAGIRQSLGCGAVPAYGMDLATTQSSTDDSSWYVPHAPDAALGSAWRTVAPKKITDLALFADWTGATTVSLGVKRSSKVTIGPADPVASNALVQNTTARTMRYYALPAPVSTPSVHLHPLTQSDFTQL